MRSSSRLARFDRWAGNVLKLRKRNSVKLAAAIAGALVLVGAAFKAAEHIFEILGRAPVDAGEVAKIRKDVEQQRDTIAAIAREANAAHNEVRIAAELSQQAKETLETATKAGKEARTLVAKASEDAERLRRTSNFAFLLSKATADDRKALNELVEVAEDVQHPFHDEALKAVQRIVADLDSQLSGTFDWKRFGVDVATAGFSDLRDMFDSRPVFDRPAILLEMARIERFRKFERLSFVYEVIRSTDSIMVLNAACNAMREEAKLHYNVLGYELYVRWWEENAADYAGAKEYKPPQILARPKDWPNVSPTPEFSPRK